MLKKQVISAYTNLANGSDGGVRRLCGRKPEFPEKTHVVEQVTTWPSHIRHRESNPDRIGEKLVRYPTTQIHVAIRIKKIGVKTYSFLETLIIR